MPSAFARSQFLLSRHGEVSDGAESSVFFDPLTKRCVKFDHLAQKGEVASDAEAAELSSESALEAHREAGDDALREALQSHLQAQQPDQR